MPVDRDDGPPSWEPWMGDIHGRAYDWRAGSAPVDDVPAVSWNEIERDFAHPIYRMWKRIMLRANERFGR